MTSLPTCQSVDQILTIRWPNIARNLLATHERRVANDGIEPTTLLEDLRELQRPVERLLSFQCLADGFSELLDGPVLNVMAGLDRHAVVQRWLVGNAGPLELDGQQQIGSVAQASRLLFGLG